MERLTRRARGCLGTRGGRAGLMNSPAESPGLSEERGAGARDKGRGSPRARAPGQVLNIELVTKTNRRPSLPLRPPRPGPAPVPWAGTRWPGRGQGQLGQRRRGLGRSRAGVLPLGVGAEGRAWCDPWVNRREAEAQGDRQAVQGAHRPHSHPSVSWRPPLAGAH